MIRVQSNEEAMAFLARALEGPIAGMLMGVGANVEAEAKRLVSQPGTGRIYPSRRPEGGSHQASSPHDPFASDTEVTRDSITHHLVEHADGGLAVRVGSPAPNARILELGGDTGRDHATHILPRPYLRPALVAQRGKAPGSRGFTVWKSS